MGQLQNTYDDPKDSYYATENTSFGSGDSPATLDIVTSLSRRGTNGYVRCDGAGDILVTISYDGTTYGNTVRVKDGETLSLRAINIDSIKITHSGTDSSYRVFVE